MAIETQQIHNVIRTYQHSLGQETPSQKPSVAPVHHEDRVSVSAEAREHHSHKAVDSKAPTHTEKSRKA